MPIRLIQLTTPLIVLALLVLAGSAWLSLQNTRTLIAREAWVQHTREVLGELRGVLAAANGAVAAERGYLLAPDPELLVPYDRSKRNARDAIERLLRLTSDNPGQNAGVAELARSVEETFALMDRGVALPSTGAAQPAALAENVVAGRLALRGIRGRIAELEAEETRLLGVRQQASGGAFNRAVLTLAGATGVAMGMVLLAYVLMRRDERTRRRAARQLSEGEARKAAVFDAVLDSIVGMDEQGRVIEWNAAAERTFGYPREKAVGKKMADLIIPPKYRDAHRDGLAHYLKTGEGPVLNQRFEISAVRSDGSEFPIELAVTPITTGGPAMFTGYIRDITDAKAAQAAIKESEERRRTALEAAELGAWHLEPDSGVFEGDERFRTIFSGTDEPLTYGRALDLIHPDDRQAVVDAVAAAVRPEDPVPFVADYRVVHPDGSVHWVYAKGRASHERDEAGRQVLSFDGTVADVTDRKNAEEALLQHQEYLREAKDEAEALAREAEALRAEAEQANVSKSQFLANMSHELRTPLNAVIMYSELLQEEAADEGVESFIPDLDKIRNAGKHLLSLVNGVLDLSKIEAGKMELFLETFAVAPMVRDVATTVQPLVETRGNTLVLDVAGDAGEMHADLTKVRQVLFNLLSNACKFTENGTVRLAVRREDQDVEMSVTDSGIGMTQEQLGRLFQAFTQADASTTRKYGGTGLGLAISKRFCEMMGGTIDVTSTPGEGTTLTVALPAKVKEPAAPDAPAAVAGDPTRGTVLVIDDDPGVREVIIRTLSEDGARVVGAADGVEGLRLAAEVRPTLIFLDVMMPKMDGWAVLTQLKNDPKLRDIPVVMLTLVNASEMGYVLGASEYLGKPIDRGRLADVLSKYRRGDAGGDGPGQVLIVEDDPATREVLRRSLVKQGWAVVEAANGRVGLERIRECVPALILLDLQMPEMDGFEFLEELRTNPEWTEVPPVVVLTSKDLTQDERDFLTGQVERVVQKGTYSREALLREVRKIAAENAGVGRGPAGEPVGPLPEPNVVGPAQADRRS